MASPAGVSESRQPRLMANVDAGASGIGAKDKRNQEHASGDWVQEREVASASVGRSQ